MPFGASRQVVSIKCHTPSRRMPIGASLKVGHFFNAIRHHDGSRLVHPAKWDIGKFRGAFMTNADWCIQSGNSFGTLFTSQFRRIPFGESRPYHHSLFIRLSIITFNFIFTFILSFKDILNLCTYFIYSFLYSFTYTHSRILIHVYLFMYTYSCIHLHIPIHMLMSYTHPCILIYVYSFIHSFTYTHSCILIYVYSFIYNQSHIHSRILIHVYSFINNQSHIHSRILIHVYSFINTHSHIHSRILITCYHFWLYVIIIVYHLTTLCVLHIFPFMFTFMFQFVFIFIFHNHFHVS